LKYLSVKNKISVWRIGNLWSW